MSLQLKSNQTTPETLTFNRFKVAPSQRPATSIRTRRRREVEHAQVMRELRVLVVDDDRDIADSLASRLHRWGTLPVRLTMGSLPSEWRQFSTRMSCCQTWTCRS